MFTGCQLVRLSVRAFVRPFSINTCPAWRDISPRIVDGLAQTFVMWVAIAEKVFKVRGRRSRSQRDQMHFLRRRHSFRWCDVKDYLFVWRARCRSGVTKVGVTRCSNWWCHSFFYLKGDDIFCRHPTDNRHHSHAFRFSRSHALRLSRWSAVKCSCKFIRKKYLDFH